MSGEPRPQILRWPLRINQQRFGEVVVFDLSGRVGHAAADALSAAFATAIHEGTRAVVLDLSGVDYISSPGLLAIDVARSHLEALHGVLVLCGLADPVRLTFDFAGFSPRCAMEPSRDRAVARALRATNL